MNIIRKSIFGVLLFSIIFYLISSGCTWITFTANDRLTDKIALKSNDKVNSIYLEVSTLRKKDSQFAKYFEQYLKDQLSAKGYKIVATSEDSKLVAKFRIFYYLKNQGKMYLFLGLIPVDLSAILSDTVSKTNGVKVFAVYATDKGRWRKTYRTYHKARLYKKYVEEINIPRIVSAIVEDLNQIIITK